MYKRQVPSMEETIRQLHERAPGVKIMVEMCIRDRRNTVRIIWILSMPSWQREGECTPALVDPCAVSYTHLFASHGR